MAYPAPVEEDFAVPPRRPFREIARDDPLLTARVVCPEWEVDLGAVERWVSWDAGADDSGVRDGDGVVKQTARFVWTPQHRRRAEMEPLRQRGDALMDPVVPLVPPGGDVVEWLMAAGAGGSEREALRRQVCEAPAWLCWDKLARGQDFYLRHAAPVGITLFNYALVGGYAAAEMNRVLEGTGYLRRRGSTSYRRLMETFKLLYDCGTGGLDALRPGGGGWASAVRVRFLHARVRRMLLRRAAGWDCKSRGVPINQEDTMFTQLGFSFIVLSGLSTMGFRVSREDREAYTHLWRYVGYLMGVDEDTNPCRDVAYSKTTTESLMMHSIAYTRSGQRLATHALRCVADFGSMGWSLDRHLAVSRSLMGDHHADGLGLPPAPRAELLFARLMFAGMRASRALLPSACTRALSRRIMRDALVSGLGEDGESFRFGFSSKRDTEGLDQRLEAQRERRLRRQAACGTAARVAAVLAVLWFLVLIGSNEQ